MLLALIFGLDLVVPRLADPISCKVSRTFVFQGFRVKKSGAFSRKNSIFHLLFRAKWCKVEMHSRKVAESPSKLCEVAAETGEGKPRLQTQKRYWVREEEHSSYADGQL